MDTNADHITLLIEELEKSLPPVIARSKIDEYLGGLISSSYMAYLDSKGEGPEGAIRLGRHIGYRKHPFLIWLKKRLSSPKEQKGIRVPRQKKPADQILNSLRQAGRSK